MRILIADDHELLRDTLGLWLQQEGIQASCAGDLDGALEMLNQAEPFDLVLLDYGMPGMRGLDGLSRMLAARTGQRVVLMSGFAPRDIAERALALGASGFLPKTLPAKTLVNAIRFMATGEQYMPVGPLTAPNTPAQSNPLAQKLSARELQVLEKLCRGSTNKEIARSLGIQEPTVKMHMKTLFRKLGASNRIQAAVIANENDLFQVESSTRPV